MHRLSRRTIPAILRSASTRYNPISSSILPDYHLSGESDTTTKRWCSVLTTGSRNAIGATTPKGSLMGCRYESTVAAASSPPAEKYEYQAEVSSLMDLIVNSLYSNKDVFLRELISNASDALDKLLFLSVTQADLLKDGIDLDIRIQADKDNGTITLTDTGIGMTRQELVDCLGTIAQSGGFRV